MKCRWEKWNEKYYLVWDDGMITAVCDDPKKPETCSAIWIDNSF